MTTNNTNATITNATINNTTEGENTMKKANQVTFFTNYGKVILDANDEKDVVTTFGLHKISYEEATRPENKDAWKAVKSFVLRPVDKHGLGLISLNGITNKTLYAQMCELFLNAGVKQDFIRKGDADEIMEELRSNEESGSKTNNESVTKNMFQNIKNKKNADGTPMETVKAVKMWFDENVSDLLDEAVEEIKVAGTEAVHHLSKAELKARKDLYESLGQEDKNLVSILKGLHGAVKNIKKYNGKAYFKLESLYMMNGIARACEIHDIIHNTLNSCNAFYNSTDEEIIAEIEAYAQAGKTLMKYVYKLRLWINNAGRKVKDLLGVDHKGTIANRVYRILKGIFNVALYGGKVLIELANITVSGIASFAIFVGGKAYEGVCWLITKVKTTWNEKKNQIKPETDAYASEDAPKSGLVMDNAVTV